MEIRLAQWQTYANLGSAIVDLQQQWMSETVEMRLVEWRNLDNRGIASVEILHLWGS